MSSLTLEQLNATLAATNERLDTVQGSLTNAGDTAFVLICAFLVFFMTPGLSYFYSGMARSKNALSLILCCFLCMSVVTIQWVCFGFSLAFSDKSSSNFIGDFSYAGFTNVNANPIEAYSTTIPGVAFALFQMTFAILTPSLIIGSSAERVRLLPTLLFVFIWATVVYSPIAYWTWGKNGWLKAWGDYDFAGGNAVHCSSGFAGLAFALVLGNRHDFGSEKYKPSSIINVFLGTALLWLGWFGFNSGSALSASGRSANAALVTTVAASAGGLTWLLLDFRHNRKFSGLGFCTGAIAALVGITPGSGYVLPGPAVAIGVLTASFCNFVGERLKKAKFVDDALEVFSVHGVGGFIGSVLTGIFADNAVGEFDGVSFAGGWMNGNFFQIVIQFCGAAAASGWSFVITGLILLVMNRIPGLSLRVHHEGEKLGLDHWEVGEMAYDFESLPIFKQPTAVDVKDGSVSTGATMAYVRPVSPTIPEGVDA